VRYGVGWWGEASNFLDFLPTFPSRKK